MTTGKILGDGNPDGVTVVKTGSELLSFWCGTPSTQFTLVCHATTCVIATMWTEWNAFVAEARTRGFST